MVEKAKLGKTRGWRYYLATTRTLLDNPRYCAKHTLDLHASDISSGELNTSPELGEYTPVISNSASSRNFVSLFDYGAMNACTNRYFECSRSVCQNRAISDLVLLPIELPSA